MRVDHEFGIEIFFSYTVFEIFAVFPRIGRFLRVYKNKIEGNKIEACGLFRSTEGHNKMILQKKKWKKVENSNFGGLFKFEISDFFNFWTFFFTFSIFPMKMWYLRYTRNYVIFRTFNYEENGRKKLKKCWKVTILQFFYKILHMLKKNRTFWVKLKIYPLYSLFEADFYAEVKTGFLFDVRQKLWILEWNMFNILEK